MNAWNTDRHGKVRASTVVGWKIAIEETGGALLRIEFSVDPALDNISALQFRLDGEQATQIGAQLIAASPQPQSSIATDEGNADQGYAPTRQRHAVR
ncbi:hypothetical protein PWG15_35485 (plasmid) [Ensifer adhaerens]|uniref:hypothetical protein n=1 Tax=Ensifer adhaerens TaxID=106592 RepID=UPI0023A99EFC|nr:hypothetical protein [Ensifer adhaerens]WDZ81639.1 hypothetical protein PWG15_35485 [Ensifer adhaerens]